MTTCIALLRGINVGRARRLPMAGLRDLVESLGFSNVRTLLNSGNVVFDAPRPGVRKLAEAIEAAVEGRFGYAAPVVVLKAADLDAIVRENRLPAAAHEAAKCLVAFVARSATLARARPLLAQSWAPEAIAIGGRAAYLWCPSGIIKSRLLPAFARLTGEGATTRNWATVLKLQAMASAGTDIA